MVCQELVLPESFREASASEISSHPFALRERDYVFHDRKFGGNAQYLKKDRFTHHSTFLWDFSPANMEYLLLPQKRPAYREDRPHTEFLTKLCDHFKARTLLFERLYAVLEKRFDLKECSLEEVLPLLQEDHRRSTEVLSN